MPPRDPVIHLASPRHELAGQREDLSFRRSRPRAGRPVGFFLFRQGTQIFARGFSPMDTHDEQLSDVCQKLHDAEARITRQQKLAETFHTRGHLREARRAREILAAFVRSYFLMQDYRQAIELDLRDHSLGQL